MKYDILFKKYNRAFTLVEISIVIIIIGLIISGVFLGANFIEQAKLRKIISDINSYIVDVNSFKSKYAYYPGDLPNADSYGWAPTPNGNGNHSIDPNSYTGSCNDTGEHQAAWAMLSQSGIIKESYVWTNASPRVYNHVPPALGGKATYGLADSSAISDGCSGLTLTKTPSILVTNVFTNGTGYRSSTTHGAALTPMQAFNIDTKIDDGIRARGKLLGWISWAGETAITDCLGAHSSGYNITGAPDTLSCKILHKF